MSAAGKKFAIALLTGAVMVSGAWAGASLTPVSSDDSPAAAEKAAVVAASVSKPTATPASAPQPAAAAAPAAPPDPTSLNAGQVLAGAAKTSILPRPQDYDGTWERSEAKCATLSENAFTSLMDDPV